MSIRCRFGLHKWVIGPALPRRYHANGTPILRKRPMSCVRCGVAFDRYTPA